MTTPAPTEATQPPAANDAANQLTATLESMTEAQRQLVSAALEAQNKRIEELNTAKTNLTEENETIKKDRAVDAAMLDSQLKQFITNMGDNATKFGLEQASCAQQLQSSNPENVRRTVDRLLMCCNTTMATRGVPAAAVNTAPLSESMVLSSAPAESAVAQTSSLKRKAEDFEPTDTDAASVLRKALANFSSN